MMTMRRRPLADRSRLELRQPKGHQKVCAGQNGRLARWLSFISSQSVDMDAAAAAATTAADAIDVFTTVQAPMRQRLPSV